MVISRCGCIFTKENVSLTFWDADLENGQELLCETPDIDLAGKCMAGCF